MIKNSADLKDAGYIHERHGGSREVRVYHRTSTGWNSHKRCPEYRKDFVGKFNIKAVNNRINKVIELANAHQVKLKIRAACSPAKN